MKLHDLKPAPGAYTEKTRIGRGYGSGKGKTGGKGMMGQKARSGPNPSRVFEGGQIPLARKLPYLRGFKNRWRVEYQVLNLEQFSEWPAGQPVTVAGLIATGVIDEKRPLKILAKGELAAGLSIEAHKFSATAREKIAAAGGTAVELPWVVERRSRSRGPNLAQRNRRTEPEAK